MVEEEEVAVAARRLHRAQRPHVAAVRLSRQHSFVVGHVSPLRRDRQPAAVAGACRGTGGASGEVLAPCVLALCVAPRPRRVPLRTFAVVKGDGVGGAPLVAEVHEQAARHHACRGSGGGG